MVAQMHLQTITVWENFTLFSRIRHLISCMTFSRRDWYDYQRKYRILIHHWRLPGSIDQETNFDNLLILNTFVCLNVSNGVEIGILLSCPSWCNLWSVVDRQTAKLASLQTFEISPQWANRLEIRILFGWS